MVTALRDVEINGSGIVRASPVGTMTPAWVDAGAPGD